jgi:hypothetical protein
LIVGGIKDRAVVISPALVMGWTIQHSRLTTSWMRAACSPYSAEICGSSTVTARMAQRLTSHSTFRSPLIGTEITVTRPCAAGDEAPSAAKASASRLVCTRMRLSRKPMAKEAVSRSASVVEGSVVGLSTTRAFSENVGRTRKVTQGTLGRSSFWYMILITWMR